MKTEWGAVNGRQNELSEHSLLKAASTQCQHTFSPRPLFLSTPIYFLTFCHFFFLCHFVTVSGTVHMLSPCISLYNYSLYSPLFASFPSSLYSPSLLFHLPFSFSGSQSRSDSTPGDACALGRVSDIHEHLAQHGETTVHANHQLMRCRAPSYFIHIYFSPLCQCLWESQSVALTVFLFIQWTLWSQILFWWTWVVSFGAKQREHWSFNDVCAVIMCLLIENYILELVFPFILMQVGMWQTKPVNESASYKFTWSYFEHKLHHVSWRHAYTLRSVKKRDRRQENTLA